ncbi:MAG: phosphoglucosamine mutase [Lachnospirales bacterium]
MGEIFGTDGVRGVANKELTPELAYNLGRAGAYVLTKEKKHMPKIIIGKDTRISGDMLEASLLSGMCSVGAIVYTVGVIPTPAIPFLIKKYNFDAGVMISASHNPVKDNGIKFFNSNGYKLSDKIELEIEDILLDTKEVLPRPVDTEIGYKKEFKSGKNDYVDFLLTTVPNIDLKGFKIVLDCANGATFECAPEVYSRLGADIYPIFNEPNGVNINDDCGSTHVTDLCKKVIELGADIGFAYDGDGDRCFCVDENGKVIEGDEILSMLGTKMKSEGILKNNTIVATIMSNLGLFIMGEKLKMNIEQTNVGDRYVLENMLENGHNLGGEQSGHIIMLDHNTTGDGILTSLQIMDLVFKENKKISNINKLMEILPQALVNAKVSRNKKNNYLKNQKVQEMIKGLEEKYNGTGRVLIRPSGTEPLVRVMIEGKDINELKNDAVVLAELIESESK